MPEYLCSIYPRLAMITLCPYSLKPLMEQSATSLSDEHIIPHALGGPDSLSVRADINTNSALGATVDSDLIHDTRLRFVAASKGVRSRSGEINAEVRGKVVDTGDEVVIAFNQNGIHSRRFVRSHRIDPETGTMQLRGFDGQFEQALDQFARGMARKGKSIQPSNHLTIQNPCIQLDIPSDPYVVHRGLAKIAYLVTFRTFGDLFALSGDGARYRAAIQASDWDAFDACKLSHFPTELPVLPECKDNEHLLACYRFGPTIFTTIKLFGGIDTATFGIAADPYHMRNLDGRLILVDSVKRTHRNLGLREGITPFEMGQRLSQLAAAMRAEKNPDSTRTKDAP